MITLTKIVLYLSHNLLKCVYGRDCTVSGNLCGHVCVCFLQLFAVGYGCTNAIQSVFVADQFTEEMVSGHDISIHFNLDKLSSVL